MTSTVNTTLETRKG